MTKQTNVTNLPQALKSYRKMLGLTKYELANSLDLYCVDAYERSNHAPANWMLEKLISRAREKGLGALKEIFEKELLLRKMGLQENSEEDPAELQLLLRSYTARELALEVLHLQRELQAKRHSSLAAHTRPSH